MGQILLLSNGHGEDVSGALIGQALQSLGHNVRALPLAGLGNPYRQTGIALLGRSHEFSTGGIGYTSLRGRLTELVQGQILYLLRRLLRLLRHGHRFDLIVVVGDVIPVIAAWLSRRPVATYLVAYSSHYEGRLRLPWPCGELLVSPRFQAVFSRDQLTADDLTGQLKRLVKALDSGSAVFLLDHHGDFYRACRDHLNIDPANLQRIEHFRSNTSVCSHPDANNRDLRDIRIDLNRFSTDIQRNFFHQILGFPSIGLSNCETHICRSLARCILNDHIDVQTCSGEAKKD